MLSFFLGSKKSKTDIFHGSSSSSDINSSIAITGKGDTAFITFTDKNKRRTEAKIKIYTLQTLKETHVYKSTTIENEIENLVNSWNTRRSNSQIIKYSNDEQLAFVFSCDNNLDENFQKLFLNAQFDRIDYFKEIKFCHLLQDKAAMNIEMLKNTPGINDERFQLLLNNTYTLRTLLNYNMTIKQVAALNDELFHLLLKNDSVIKNILNLGISIEKLNGINLDKLSKCLESNWELNDALKFVTIEQILDINHIPKPIEVNLSIKNENDAMIFVSGFSSGSGGGYRYTYGDNSLYIHHEKSNSKFIIKFGILKDEMCLAVDKAIEDLEPLELIHKWYTISSNTNNENQLINILYCPELQIIHQEFIDSAFPQEEFRINYNSYFLTLTAYYKENQFIKFLNDHGCRPLELKQLPGMTQDKFELLYEHKHDLEFLLKAGIKINDFAKVDLNRLTYILENSTKAERALKFVDARELLGIHGIIKRHSQGLFESASPKVSSNESVNVEARTCVLM